MKKIIYVIVIILLLVTVVGGVTIFKQLSTTPKQSADSKAAGIRIGFSLGTSREERWQKDAADFTARANKLGASVDVKYSGEDPDLQLQQAENLIIQGVNVLVVVANDANKSAEIVDKAHAAGVKVIAYDRMISKSDVDMFITYDSREIGRLEAEEIIKNVPKGTFAYIGGSQTDNNASLLKEGSMKVLQPLIDKGDIKIALSTFSNDWKPEEAYKAMKEYLATGKTVDAVIAANDGTAGGVIQALKEKGLAGKVAVSGQDADVAACQRIILGTQTMTVYKPFNNLAFAAAEAAVAFASNNKPQQNGTLNNGKIDVPSYFLTPTSVTKENMDSTIIKDGFHTRTEIYQTAK